jgi:hypothetical protein
VAGQQEQGTLGATTAQARGAGRPGRGRGPRRRGPAAQQPVAAELPVARVLVDVPLAHLDRPFDYLVPERMTETAVPGCRVRVRFAGQLTGGYLLERVATSDHQGRLALLERVVSPERVLTPEIAALAREVADRYAGTVADVPGWRSRGRGGAGGGWDRAAPDPGTSRVSVGHGSRGPRRGRGRGTRPGRLSWRRWPAGGHRVRFGRPCRAGTGRRRSRAPRRPQPRRGGGR